MAKVKVKRSTGTDLPLMFEAFEDFIGFKEAVGTSPKTTKNYTDSFKKFCEFYEFDSSTEITELNASLFYKWMNTLKLAGLKTTSVQHYLRDVRTFAYWCMEADRRYIEPFKIVLPKGQEEELKMFSDEDLELLLRKPARNAEFVEWRMWAVTNFCLGTGARAATVCSVVIGNIDFKRKEITFPHTKNKIANIVPMSSALETCLRDYIRTWRNGEPDEAYLFCNISGEGLTTDALKHAFARYCERRGASRTNIHGLRHNFAKGWVKNNGNMFALQKIMGHQSLEMSKKYVRLYGEDIKDDFDRFNPLDSMKRTSKRTQTVKRT